MGKQWKQWQTLFWGGFKINADGDCSHEIKRRLLLGRKAMTNLDSILKSKDITLLTKVCLIKAIYGFSSSYVWMWELDYKESWTLKNRFFWNVVLEKTLESPLDCKEIQPVYPKGNQSWIFTEGVMLKLKLQYFGDLTWRTDSLEKTLKLGKKAGREGDDRGWDGWMASPTRWIWAWVSLGSWEWTGRPGMLQSVGSQRVGHDRTAELNWTEKWTSILLGPAFIWLFVVTAGPPWGKAAPLPSLSPLLFLDILSSPMRLPGLQSSLRPAPWWTTIAFFWL